MKLIFSSFVFLTLAPLVVGAEGNLRANYAPIEADEETRDLTWYKRYKHSSSDSSSSDSSSSDEDKKIKVKKTKNICKDVYIDFAEFSPGEVVSDLGNGITVEALRENGLGKLLTNKNRAMIFNTDKISGEDEDLNAKLGNALIISEDLDSTDPDDNEHGGLITMKFENPYTKIKKIQFIDVDEEGLSRGETTISGVHSNGSVFESIVVPTTPDGGVQFVTVDQSSVKELRIDLAGSGAIPKIIAEDCSSECADKDVYVACATNKYTLECYVDGLTYKNFKAVKDYLKGGAFCEHGSTCAGQACRHGKIAMYKAPKAYCPKIGYSKCYNKHQYKSFATYKLTTDCKGNVKETSCGSKCTSGVCKCDYGASTFCNKC